uniref:Uncharacterized protein n=1 Tax=Chrysemys picta bellii TaxID=8478 RepID=A0A8C3PFF5_CHRPI
MKKGGPLGWEFSPCLKERSRAPLSYSPTHEGCAPLSEQPGVGRSSGLQFREQEAVYHGDVGRLCLGESHVTALPFLLKSSLSLWRPGGSLPLDPPQCPSLQHNFNYGAIQPTCTLMVSHLISPSLLPLISIPGGNTESVPAYEVALYSDEEKPDTR